MRLSSVNQPPQYPVIHHPSQEMSEEVFQAKGNLMKSIQTFLEKFNCISFGVMPKVLLQAWEKFFAVQHAQPEDTNELFQKLLKDLQIINEELAEYINSLSWNRPTFYDNEEEHSIQYKEYLENSSNAIAPVLPTEEPEYSLSMGYEHPSTTSETESDEVIKSSVKNLVQIPSEYGVTSNDESECDVPIKDESSPVFTTFSNPIFDDNDDFTSSNDESLTEEDVPMENFKEFSGELAHINPLLPGIKEADFDLEEEIRLVENLLYNNSSPRPPKELNAEIANTIVESLSLSPIPVENSDSFIDEIDLLLATDGLMPPGSESGDYDSEGDIHFLEEILVNDSISLSKNESSNFDHHDDPSFPRPPSEPPDVEFFFDVESD
nr:hypothetical protein [Tanacetum cinerariifolium]